MRIMSDLIVWKKKKKVNVGYQLPIIIIQLLSFLLLNNYILYLFLTTHMKK
jgi:hypothetical protein